MGTARAPAPTVTFVDEYCAAYRDLFDDVRSFEHLSLLHYIVAIRENHSVLMPRNQRVRWTRWRPFQRVFSDGSEEKRFVRECVFGKRRSVRYYELTSDPEKLPAATTRFVMTNMEGELRQSLGNDYGLPTWIEYGYKQLKNELGWADYRLTDYHDIERWWELGFSAYLMEIRLLDVEAGPHRHPIVLGGDQLDPAGIGVSDGSTFCQVGSKSASTAAVSPASTGTETLGPPPPR